MNKVNVCHVLDVCTKEKTIIQTINLIDSVQRHKFLGGRSSSLLVSYLHDRLRFHVEVGVAPGVSIHRG